MRETDSSRQLRGLAVSIGLGLAALYYALSALASDGAGVRPVQPDFLIYAQYARAAAEGHAYSFNAGDAPTTGATSHLYPLVLGLFYKLGATGEALFTAAFALNALLLAAFLALLAAIYRKAAPRRAGLALALAASTGPVAFAFFGLSETGLFCVVTAGALAASLHRRSGWMIALTALAPAVRPEGVLLAAGWCAAGIASWSRQRRGPAVRATLAAGAAGLAMFVAVLGVNLWLTGSFGFDSTAQKSHAALQTPWGALVRTAQDALQVATGLVFGVGDPRRVYYFLPVAAGLLGLAGVLVSWRAYRNRAAEAAWGMAALATVAAVAFSGWQGTHADRYLVWLLPFWALCIARGADWAIRRWRLPAVALSVLLVGGSVLGHLHFTGVFIDGLAPANRLAGFARQVEQAAPPESRVGVTIQSGVAYYWDRLRVFNVHGVTHPHFRGSRHAGEHVDALKRNPDLRFEYWLVSDGADTAWQAFFGDTVIADTWTGAGGAMRLCKADWSGLAAAGRLPGADGAGSGGWKPVDRMDVAFAPDERQHMYSILLREPFQSLDPCLVRGAWNGRPLAEGGRVVLGGEAFRVTTAPGRPLRVVLRTAAAAAAIRNGTLYQQPAEFEFKSPMTLTVRADDRPPVSWRFDLAAGTNAITEAVLDLPASEIQRDRTRLQVLGDHVSLDYGFYQPGAR